MPAVATRRSCSSQALQELPPLLLPAVAVQQVLPSGGGRLGGSGAAASMKEDLVGGGFCRGRRAEAEAGEASAATMKVRAEAVSEVVATASAIATSWGAAATDGAATVGGR